MTEKSILQYLANEGAILTDSHFIFTSGKHGTAYFNMREVAHQTGWLQDVCEDLAARLSQYDFDLVVGPETLGRTLAQFVGPRTRSQKAVWCDMSEIDGVKHAAFSPKLDFGRLVPGERVVIIDDLLTTGTSVKAVSELIESLGGTVVAAAVVVRRQPEVTAEDCGVPALEVLAEVSGVKAFTPEECADHGPCSKRVPVVLRPGHGHEWIKSHEGYPVAS